MKVGILTRRYGYNMGSTLQAYAMFEMIHGLGHEVEIIDYDESSAHPVWKVRPFTEHLLYRFHIPPKGVKRDYLEHRMAQESKFNEFESKYLPLTPIKYSSKSQLRKLAYNYDKIVVGSDQIWNPFLFDPNFFGAFLKHEDKSHLIPYSPSFGTSDITTISKEQVDLMKALSVFSCREEAGAEIINEITAHDATVTLDPTLMIEPDKWKKIALYHPVHNKPDKYVLTYFLGTNIPEAEINRIANINNVKIVNISMFNKPNGIKADIHAKKIGPGEFLYLIKNAHHILTDSFHATIFSWIFKKNFTVFERFKSCDINNQNSRIETLLSVLGATSHLYGSDKQDKDSNFEECKRRSLAYLIENLK